MDAVGERPDRYGGREGSPPSSSSPLSSPSPTQSWPPAESPPDPPWMNSHQMELDHDPLDRRVGMQSSSPPRSYEELFCSRTAGALVPLSGALVAPSGPRCDVVMRGYLGKLERNHRRYFVLRAGSHTGPSRLEWYRSQDKFKAAEESAGKAALFGPSKQGTIYLRCCLGVSRVGSSRKGHTVALYATDQTLVLVLEDQLEQERWYQAIKKLMEEEREDEEGFDEEDDGYCTLPHAGFFKEVWPVTVKPRGLGCSKSLAGERRLCLTVTSLVLVRVAACGGGGGSPSLAIPLLAVRRFGHLDGAFFLELGRSAPHGPGEIWMEARDQGNPTGAQNIHEAVRETVRKLRALPDFSRSPTSNPNQLKPKYRGRMVKARPPGPRRTPRNPETQTSYPEPGKPDGAEPESYVEMKVDRPVLVVRAWDPGEEEEEGEEEGGGPGYMMMSPQTSHSSCGLPRDDYVTMASPRKQDRPAYSSPSSSHQTSFNSSASDTPSPLRLARLIPVQPTETEAGQSRIGINRNATERRQVPDLSPVVVPGGSSTMIPFVSGGLDRTRPDKASPGSGPGRSGRVRAAPAPSVRRRLASCLPSCLQAADRS